MTRRDSGALIISTAAVRRAILFVVFVALIAAAAYYGRGAVLRSPAAADHIDHAAYQVVFLSGGQAFYGKLNIADGDTYLLADVFYLVNNDAGQPGRLVRRGNEVFGPREPMVISAAQVLFFENLRDDSEVVSGIRAIKSGQVPTPAPAATVRPSATR